MLMHALSLAAVGIPASVNVRVRDLPRYTDQLFSLVDKFNIGTNVTGKLKTETLEDCSCPIRSCSSQFHVKCVMEDNSYQRQLSLGVQLVIDDRKYGEGYSQQLISVSQSELVLLDQTPSTATLFGTSKIDGRSSIEERRSLVNSTVRRQAEIFKTTVPRGDDGSPLQNGVYYIVCEQLPFDDDERVALQELADNTIHSSGQRDKLEGAFTVPILTQSWGNTMGYHANNSPDMKIHDGAVGLNTFVYDWMPNWEKEVVQKRRGHFTGGIR